MIRYILPPIHPSGWVFIFLFFTLTVLSFLLWMPLGLGFLLLFVWCVYFFRDPRRIIDDNDREIVAPADGLVIGVSKILFPPKLLPQKPFEECIKISIFMSVFNVHVNRIPTTGEVIALKYHSGQFLNASFDKASDANERQAIWVKRNDGQDIVFVQVAGLVARRIVCRLKPGQKVIKGAKFGIIKFGSRLDIYLPLGVKIKILKGQTAVGGETVLAVVNE